MYLCSPQEISQLQMGAQKYQMVSAATKELENSDCHKRKALGNNKNSGNPPTASTPSQLTQSNNKKKMKERERERK